MLIAWSLLVEMLFFTSPLFSAIEDLLLHLYYLYEKSPKKSSDLAGIIEDLKEVFGFPKGGNLPIRCQGTRWVSHKRKALQRVVDRYGAYIAHLIALTEDRSLKTEDRECCRGYLRKWKQPKILIGCAMYIEALKPVSLLSLSLQSNGADIVLSMVNTMKSVKALKKTVTTSSTRMAYGTTCQGKIARSRWQSRISGSCHFKI